MAWALAGQPAAAATEEASNDQQQGGAQVKIVPDSITSVGIPFLLCFLLVLLWALGIRAAKEWPRWKAKQQGSPVQKQFRAKMETLINSIADLDELFASGKIAEKQYWKERLELKAKAVAILKAGPSTKPKPYASRRSNPFNGSSGYASSTSGTKSPSASAAPNSITPRNVEVE